MDITLFGIPNCDTVRKARDWLDARGIAYRFHDFKTQGLPDQALDEWLEALGWERVLNRRGTTWHRLDDAQRASVGSLTSARALLIAHPMLIRRPVVRWPDGGLSVGFSPEDFARRATP